MANYGRVSSSLVLGTMKKRIGDIRCVFFVDYSGGCGEPAVCRLRVRRNAALPTIVRSGMPIGVLLPSCCGRYPRPVVTIIVSRNNFCLRTISGCSGMADTAQKNGRGAIRGHSVIVMQAYSAWNTTFERKKLAALASSAYPSIFERSAQSSAVTATPFTVVVPFTTTGPSAVPMVVTLALLI